MKRWLLPMVVLVVLASGWGWLVRPRPDSPVPAMGQATDAAPPVVTVSPLPASAAPATVAARPAAPLPPAWDLCGLGRLPVPAGAAASDHLPGPLGEHSLQAWLPAWKARLEAGDARSRAAALLFAPEQPTADVAALVQLARTSRDPVVWAWAFGSCGGTHADAACSGLDPVEWARDDPGNAWPWLMLGEADPQRRREALAAAAKATRVQTYAGQLVDRVLRAAPPDMPRYLRRQPLLDAMGIEATFTPPALTGLPVYCRAAPAECQAVAGHLAERADTWHLVGIGTALGEQLGWPSERLAALKQERRRGEAVNAMPLLTLHAQPHACDAIEGAERFVAGVAAAGETGAARQAPR